MPGVRRLVGVSVIRRGGVKPTADVLDCVLETIVVWHSHRWSQLLKLATVRKSSRRSRDALQPIHSSRPFATTTTTRRATPRLPRNPNQPCPRPGTITRSCASRTSVRRTHMPPMIKPQCMLPHRNPQQQQQQRQRPSDNPSVSLQQVVRLPRERYFHR